MRDGLRWAVGLVPVMVAVAVLTITGVGGASPIGTGGGSGLAPTAPTGSNATPPPPFASSIRHVFLIVMENEQTGLIYGPQPYETELAHTYAWGGDANSAPGAVGYYAVCHPSTPNYLALTSGLAFQCGDSGYRTYAVNNLGNTLDRAGDSWIAYEESASVACQTYDSGRYVVRHNPFAFYTDLNPGVSGGACDAHDVPIANLTEDYPYSTVPPAFTYIAPNTLNDGHSSTAATGDYWLSTFVSNLTRQSWFSSSIIFVTYDEAYVANGSSNTTGYSFLTGGPVYMVAVSPFTRGVGAIDENASHFNLLSTIEWLLRLPPTGTGHDGTTAFPPLTALFPKALWLTAAFPKPSGAAISLAFGTIVVGSAARLRAR
jgi:phosphatidylinositol-3-phosphatase